MRSIVLIAHNIRSTHNVGSLLRTAEGLGIREVFLTGYTPYPKSENDARLPHLAQKLHRQIHKTALGAEDHVQWKHAEDIFEVLISLKTTGFTVAAVEQAANSTALQTFMVPEKIALLVGREVEGIEPAVLEKVDHILEIPMSGHKESLNVAQAAAMALYHCSFAP